VLDAMAAKVHDLGAEVGLGSAFKMINQLLAGMHIAAAGEAIAFAAKQGLDLRNMGHSEEETRPKKRRVQAIPCERVLGCGRRTDFN
jgi:3-hydroxyisobutyrate dehydrogenase-like beta-hydroxyacid dehydrogenase